MSSTLVTHVRQMNLYPLSMLAVNDPLNPVDVMTYPHAVRYLTIFTDAKRSHIALNPLPGRETGYFLFSVDVD